MAINWPDLNLPPINQQVLIPADQFYSERKPTKGIQAMKAQYKAHMGDDLLVVDAARVSFSNESWYIDNSYVPDKNSKHFEAWLRYAQLQDNQVKPCLSLADYGLIQYLASHGHWTPTAHPQITLRMKAPVPIRTQCFKHKQGFVENEESRRYIKSRPQLFVPNEFRVAPENAKQGSGGRHPYSSLWRGVYKDNCLDMIKLYEEMVDDGVAPEQARLCLPQGVQVQWIWTGSLAAFARFVRQRQDSHAQKEIQELAEAVDQIIRPLFPISWEALTK
jgi:thymidylate synthase (FAD)